MSRLNELSITDASEKLSRKEISAVDLARDCLAEISRRNPSLNAYLEVFEDAEAQACRADERRAAGERHPLLGIPLALKDNILIEGRRASAASRMLEPYVASYDATIIRKLKEVGAVFLGRTNMDEFALGSSTENSAFTITKNPHDERRVAGGTSGGSAAAVAAHLALGALGTDTGGSVRNPSSFCGTVGLKPTYGVVSRSGLVAAVSSFDQAGPIAKTAEDAALLFEAIRGPDGFDSTALAASAFTLPEGRKIIGIPEEFLESNAQGMDEQTCDRFAAVKAELVARGYQLQPIMLPSLGPALAAYYIINFAEVSTNLARFDGVRYGLSRTGKSLFDDYATSRSDGFGLETRRRIALGTYVLSAGYYDSYYGKAVAVREQLRLEYTAVFAEVDFVMTPTMPRPAFKVGEKNDPLSLYLEDVFTVPANLTGNPAISLPMGTVTKEGKALPVGVQLTASHGNEVALFQIGKELAL